MDKPTPKTTFGGKPMGGLARIVHEYFGTDLEKPVVDLPAFLVSGPDRGEPYINSHGTHCVACGAEIRVMCFQMTGVCSEICRKVRDGEIEAPAPAAA